MARRKEKKPTIREQYAKELAKANRRIARAKREGLIIPGTLSKRAAEFSAARPTQKTLEALKKETSTKKIRDKALVLTDEGQIGYRQAQREAKRKRQAEQKQTEQQKAWREESKAREAYNEQRKNYGKIEPERTPKTDALINALRNLAEEAAEKGVGERIGKILQRVEANRGKPGYEEQIEKNEDKIVNEINTIEAKLISPGRGGKVPNISREEMQLSLLTSYSAEEEEETLDEYWGGYQDDDEEARRELAAFY